MPKRRPKTITLFDGPGGDNSKSLEAVPVLASAAQAVQARSLLIESLVEQLCTFIEQDSHKQKKLYLYICQKLTNLKFLVPGLPADESLPIRKKFKELTKDFIKLSIRNCESQQPSNLLVPLGANSNSLLSPDIPFDFSGLLNGDIIFHNSRYIFDFVEEEVIASGGFGIVCKAWKKVDQQYYAVKKIPFQYVQDPLLNKVLREVEFLAQNSHPNLVAYKTAWIEPSTNGDPLIEGRSDSSCETDYSGNQPSEAKHARTEEDSFSMIDEDNEYVVFQAESTERSYRTETYHESCQISVFNEHRCSVPNTEFSVTTERTVEEYSAVTKKTFGMNSSTKASSDPPKSETVRPVLRRTSSEYMSLVPIGNCPPDCSDKLCKGVLYVQMELCQENLRQWLDRRQERGQGVDVSQSMAIVKQVIKGVEYLHSKGIIHRDLKPQNILFTDNCVKIGDFGLATLCCQDGSENANKKSMFEWTHHTQGVGTSPYAAPEQRNGQQYEYKADMYSVGVILLELLYPFHTSMELSKCMEDICHQKYNLPKELLRDQPQAAKMVVLLTQADPLLRPSASDVLNSELFLSKSQIIENLKKEIAQKDNMIRALEKENSQLRLRLEKSKQTL